MIRLFDAIDGSHEAAYRSWSKENPSGLTVQSMRKLNSGYLVLHRAPCPSVTSPYKAGRTDQFTAGRYIKICATEESELIGWLSAKGLKKFSKYCARCRPPSSSWLSTAKSKNSPDAEQEPIHVTHERRRITREIEARRGAPAFRNTLLRAYDGRCAATGCRAREALEAAHIQPYSQDGANKASNGLLLRADIHTLFDLGYLALDGSRKWVVSPSLRNTEYGRLHGKALREPIHVADRADAQALKQHRRTSKLKKLLVRKKSLPTQK